LLRQTEDLYVPQDERTLARLQRKAEEIDRRVRGWAQTVADVLPKGLSMLDDETYILSLFLAQQRRLNMQLDSQNPPETLRSKLGRFLPLFAETEDDWEMIRAAHRIVSTRLESDIDRACQFFCRDRDIPPISDPSIDWRVAIRYLAQELHHIASQINMRTEYATSPRRFELALKARDQAAEVVDRRRRMIAAFAPSEEPV